MHIFFSLHTNNNESSIFYCSYLIISFLILWSWPHIHWTQSKEMDRRIKLILFDSMALNESIFHFKSFWLMFDSTSTDTLANYSRWAFSFWLRFWSVDKSLPLIDWQTERLKKRKIINWVFLYFFFFLRKEKEIEMALFSSVSLFPIISSNRN